MCAHPMGAVCLVTLPNAHCISHHYRVGSPTAQLHHSLIPVVRAGNLSTFQVLKVLAWTSLLKAVSENSLPETDISETEDLERRV